MNNRLEEFKDDITAKKTEIQTLEDASTDMMMLEDDDEKIPYQIGEVFVSMTQVNTQFLKNWDKFFRHQSNCEFVNKPRKYIVSSTQCK